MKYQKLAFLVILIDVQILVIREGLDESEIIEYWGEQGNDDSYIAISYGSFKLDGW